MSSKAESQSLNAKCRRPWPRQIPCHMLLLDPCPFFQDLFWKKSRNAVWLEKSWCHLEQFFLGCDHLQSFSRIFPTTPYTPRLCGQSHIKRSTRSASNVPRLRWDLLREIWVQKLREKSFLLQNPANSSHFPENNGILCDLVKFR